MKNSKSNWFHLDGVASFTLSDNRGNKFEGMSADKLMDLIEFLEDMKPEVEQAQLDIIETAMRDDRPEDYE